MFKLVEICEEGDGDFIGFAIKNVDLMKFESLYIYEDFDEVTKTVAELNAAVEIRKFWPSPDDPEVQELLNDSTFHSVEREDVEVPDYDRSTLVYVWETPPVLSTEGGLVSAGIPKMGVDGKPVIDFRSSVIRYKIERHPKLVQAKGRFDMARELIARKRLTESLNATN